LGKFVNVLDALKGGGIEFFIGIADEPVQGDGHLRRINGAVKNLDQIRGSVITHWVKVYDLRKAQYLAGHRYVSSTEDYKQQLLDELQDDVKKFHPF